MGTDVAVAKQFDATLAKEALSTVPDSETVINEVNRYLGSARTAHSPFQIDHFILGMAGITDYGKYTQALRELNSRFGSLKGSVAERKKKEIDLRRKELLLQRSKNQLALLESKESQNEEEAKEKAYTVAMHQLEIEELEIEINSLILAIESQERSNKETLREFIQFFARAQEYERACGLAGREGEDRAKKEAELEEDFWTKNFESKITNSVLSHGAVGPDIVEVLRVMPEHIRKHLFEFKDQEQLKLMKRGIQNQIKARQIEIEALQKANMLPPGR